ncbi:MAG: TonB family protein [Trichlorobacter sp.]|uniref:energy transducer TonB n=1 Tax=Trichlorobacter sp. TaxID=2911007 RepID=UPI00256DA94F|nr:energy transducer TonB [Trichlorobacter sp.]MDK9718344.1 TonB family protein [Trichlorobacter sp.]
MTIIHTNQNAGRFRLFLLASLLLHGSITLVTLFLLPKRPDRQPDSPGIIMVNLATPTADKNSAITTLARPSVKPGKQAAASATPTAPIQPVVPAATVSATPQARRIETAPDRSITPTAPASRGRTGAVADQPTKYADTGQSVSGAPQSASAGKAVPREMTFGSAGGPAFRKQTQPVYPSLARRRGKEGVVVLKLSISETGHLTHVELIEDPGYGFAEAAIEAVRSSSFSPAHYNGKPVAIQAILPIRFTLR